MIFGWMRPGRLRLLVSAAGGVLLLALVLLGLLLTPQASLAQADPTATPAPPGEGEEIEAPERVDVVPQARDEQISRRLQNILEATGWFTAPEVRVEQGVVFLTGRTDRQEFKEWAGSLAQRTQDVVAVVNQLQVTEPSVWDFSPAIAGLQEQLRRIVRSLPLLLVSFVILLFAAFFAYVAGILARKSLQRRELNRLLVSVIGRAVGLLVFLVGIYVVFQVAGLATVALTVLGGTGLLGLILGIAFQDITENFLASILLSVQNPFHSGDLVRIDDVTGFVQMMTLRTTVLMTQDGNHVQIPNSTVFKSKIYNFTSNPNRRVEFMIGIGYDDVVSEAQEIALQVMREHPAVLPEPEPLVLVDSLGPSTVNLKVYFWVDGSAYGVEPVKSSIIRLVKLAYQNGNISIPGETRQLLFPEVISIRQREDGQATGQQRAAAAHAEEPPRVSTDAEAGLRRDADEIEQQARDSRPPEEGTNLLETSDEK